MKKLIAGVMVLGILAVPTSLTEPKILNSSQPQPAGNGNCEYANGLVMLCPARLLYNRYVNEPQVPQSVSTAIPPVPASAPSSELPSDSGGSPAPEPAPAQGTISPPATPQPQTTTPDGVVHVNIVHL